MKLVYFLFRKNNVISNFMTIVFDKRIFVVFIILIIQLFSCNKSEKLNYRFSGKDLCNESNGIPIKFISEEEIKNHGINKIYNFDNIDIKDSIKISYKVLSDCCQEPKDSLIITDKEIKLINAFKSSKLCDCYCDYHFQYVFSKEFINNRKIVTNNY